MAQHLQELRDAAESQMRSAPLERQAILDRYEAEAARFVETRRQQKLAQHYEGLVWGEAIGAGLFAIAFVFDWHIVSYLGIVLFMTCWGNTWFEGRKPYANPRLHGYVLSGSMILIAFAFILGSQKYYDPEAIYRIEHKRSGVTQSTELRTGRELQAREEPRLQGWKKTGITLLVIGGAILLRSLARDIKRSSDRVAAS